MKYKTLFRLMLKGLGVWLSVLGLMRVLDILASIVSTTLFQRGSPIGMSAYWFSGFSSIVELGIGLYLFFDGRWVADKAIPSNRPYCHECGYDLTGATGDVCNECGTPFRASEASAASRL